MPACFHTVYSEATASTVVSSQVVSKDFRVIRIKNEKRLNIVNCFRVESYRVKIVPTVRIELVEVSTFHSFSRDVASFGCLGFIRYFFAVILCPMKWGEVTRILVISGVVLIFLGVAIPYLGKLPGDVSVKRENWSFYFPLATCLIISIVITLVVRFFSGGR